MPLHNKTKELLKRLRKFKDDLQDNKPISAVKVTKVKGKTKKDNILIDAIFSQKKICIACSGTGKSSKGKECYPCNGTGKEGERLKTL